MSLAEKVGVCQHCGLDIVDMDDKYACESYVGVLCEDESRQFGQHDVIYKDALKRMGGCSLDTRDAKALFDGQRFKVQLQSRKSGRYYYAPIYYNKEKQQVVVDFGSWR